MSISRSVLTSCAISAIGKSGARSSGPTGCLVPGCSTAGGGDGRSARMLYQRLGRRDSSRTYFTVSFMMFPSRDADVASLFEKIPDPVKAAVVDHVRGVRAHNRVSAE